jgi:NAD(P)-dependent dehydrogenase (short-subunit alcohol dehydrogenase family)
MLGEAGATVYCTGRTTRERRSEYDRPETIEETAELVSAAGGTGVAVRVDHARSDDVAALAARIEAEHGGLDVLVNDVWGGDGAIAWDTPYWQHDLDAGLGALRNAIDTHVITSWHVTPLLRRRPGALLVEVTDGNDDRYRGNLFYDLAKDGTIRLARAEAAELAPSAVTVVALTPGFLRSEAMLDHFGVTADTWREGIARDRHFAASETPRFVGRAVAHLAADPERARWHGRALSSWELARTYGFTDVDGATPDWGAHYAEHVIG